MRKSTTIKITDRARELTFRITEMSATQLEGWTLRALQLVSAAGIATPDDAGVTRACAFLMRNLPAVVSALDYEKAKPLLDEMLACCARIDAGIEQVCTPDTVDGYIEDMRTLLKLRVEAVKFNFSFLQEGTASGSVPEGITVKARRA